jgi:hypothetical protein
VTGHIDITPLDGAIQAKGPFRLRSCRGNPASKVMTIRGQEIDFPAGVVTPY